MVSVEVRGTCVVSGLVELLPSQAARWQAVLQRLCCSSLDHLLHVLLQIVEKHCSGALRQEEEEFDNTNDPSGNIYERSGQFYAGKGDFAEGYGGPSHCEMRIQNPDSAWESDYNYHDCSSSRNASSPMSEPGIEWKTREPDATDSVPQEDFIRERNASCRLSVVTSSRPCDKQLDRVAHYVGDGHVYSGTEYNGTLDSPLYKENLHGSVIHKLDTTSPYPRHPIDSLTPPNSAELSPTTLLFGECQNHSFSSRSASTDITCPSVTSRPCVLRRGYATYCEDKASTGDMTSSQGVTIGSQQNLIKREEIRLNEAVREVDNELDDAGVLEESEERQPTCETAQDTDTPTNGNEPVASPPLSKPIRSASSSPNPASASPCTSCNVIHVSAVCPLLSPQRWLQDANGATATETLPPGLIIDGSTDEGDSTVRVGPNGLAAFTLLGPLRGQETRPEKISDATDLKQIWEIYGEDQFVDTSDESAANWMRYMRPAPERGLRTVALLTRQGSLFGITTGDLTADQELLFWQDDPTDKWRRKNMLKLSCGGCNLRFEHPLYYRRHCSLFHEPGQPLSVRKYYCKVCGQAVLGRQKLLRHAAERHGGAGAYQCQHCSKFFRRLSYLELHRNHGCAANPSRTYPLCHLCGTLFCQPQKLRVHLRRMHSDSAGSLSEFRCGSCGRLLGCRTALKRHLREVHGSPTGRQTAALSCRRCGKPFQNRSNLKIHMLTHSGVKPFHCEVSACGATFTTKQCLQYHYRRVHQLTDSDLPPIRRAVPYTLSAYSGGILDESGSASVSNRRRLTRSDAITESELRADRLRFPDFSVSRDLPDPANGPRLMHDASRTELDSIEPSVGLILDMSNRNRADQPE